MKRVGLIGDNSIDYVNTLIDIWKDGNSAVLVDWRIPFHKAMDLLIKSNVFECYIDKGIYKKNLDKLSEKILFNIIEKSDNRPEIIPSKLYEKFKPIYSSEEALVFFSSGTTGEAKGIILSHNAINTNADAIIDYMQLQKTDVFYIVKTLAHSSTLVGELLVALKTNTRAIISPTVVSPNFSLDKMEELNATIVCVNPTLLNLYTIAAKSKIREFKLLHTIYTSGAIADKNLIMNAQSVFKTTKILNVYGLTEAGPRVTAQRSNNNNIGSVGKPINGVNVIAVDVQGKIMEKDERGIIHVNTPSKFYGYVHGCTSKKSLYKDWLNTGDVGYFDEDKNLYITGRYDNMIIQGSHNIYPEDIERVICKHPYIKECIVFGAKSDLYGQRIICYFVTDNVSKVLSEIRDFCSNELAVYEIPHEFISLGMLPKTEGGKISHKLAQEFYYNNFINK